MQISDQELQLAWKRTKKSVMRSFINPFELTVLDSFENEWLSYLKTLIESGNYKPSSPYAIDVPKQNGAVRLGSSLCLEDTLMLTLLVGINISQIQQVLSWSAGQIVFSHVIKENPDDDFVENFYQAWEKFGEKSVEILEEGYSFVLFTDITAYYENINLQQLVSDLSDLGVTQEVLKSISACLNKWSFNQCDGLPQGYVFSDILSNLYLNNVDHQLHDLGFRFIRYGDDYRFFCKTHKEARIIQMELTKILRSRGLNLQNEKTQILQPKEAIEKIDGVRPYIEVVKNKILDEVFSNQQDSEYTSSYWTVWSEREPESGILAGDSDFIQETFDAHFVDSFDENLPKKKTLFRFCLNELGKLGNNHAVNQSLAFLRRYPEETSFILKYLSKVGLTEPVLDNLLEYLSSGDSIYYYQKYLILEWIDKQNQAIAKIFLQTAKVLAFDANTPQYLRGTCCLIIGKAGSPADLERLKTLYRDDLPEIERVKLIVALSRMEKRKRNTFLGQIRNNSLLIARSISLAKQITS